MYSFLSNPAKANRISVRADSASAKIKKAPREGCRRFVAEVVGSAGFEPATKDLVGPRSIR